MVVHFQCLARAAAVIVLAVSAGCYVGLDGRRIAGAGNDGGDGGSGDDEDLECADAPIDAGPTPMRRLTRLEYNNSVRDLLGDTSEPAWGFVEDEVVAGFEANGVAPVSQTQVEQYIAAAEQLAASAVATKLEDLLGGCDAADSGCVEAFAETFGGRVFRRPLDAGEVAAFVSLYEGARTEWGADKGIELVLTAMLASPSFLYHIELGEPSEEDVVPLSSHEVASRLSYFLWASTPDAELLDVAASDGLATPEGIEAQARRMLEDDRARDAIASFHGQWLEIGHMDEVFKDATLFPEWNEGVADAAVVENRKFIEHVLIDGDARLETLLTASYSFVDASLAGIYGVAAPDQDFDRVELDPEQRAGLLTQVAFLSTHAYPTENAWVQRGKFVRERLLCESLPPPPPGVDNSEPNDPNRQTTPECAGCHAMMDPIGWGFDSHNSIGAYRTVDENGEPIDSTGNVAGWPEIGEFEGVTELAHALARNEEVSRCVAAAWLHFAVRRDAEEDGCSQNQLENDFVAADGDIRELLIAVTSSDAFRYRPAAQ